MTLGSIACLSLSAAGLLRQMGPYLEIDEPLMPAAAIVVLAGGFPGREREAADLYRAGLAPTIVIAREAQNREAWWRAVGGRTTTDLQRDVLIRGGVSQQAILVPDGEAVATLDELELVHQALPEADGPVILVTSAYHARRVQLTWRHLTDDRPHAIMRVTRHEAFDATRWWQDPRSARAVLREYVGLLDAWLGFPVASGLARRAKSRSRRLACQVTAVGSGGATPGRC
jgi:uncharacterized SAM-binding protein YcdF (DUF218 family)